MNELFKKVTSRSPDKEILENDQYYLYCPMHGTMTILKGFEIAFSKQKYYLANSEECREVILGNSINEFTIYSSMATVVEPRVFNNFDRSI